MKRKLLSTLLIVTMCVSLCACGSDKDNSKKDSDPKTTESSENEASNKEETLNIYNQYWNAVKEKFPTAGGDISQNVIDEPAKFDMSVEYAADTLKSTFLIPEEIVSDIHEITTMVHMMNANSFAGVVFSLETMSPDEAADLIQKTFNDNQFICGAPEKIYIAINHDCVFFAFGATDIIDELQELNSGSVTEKFVSGVPY